MRSAARRAKLVLGFALVANQISCVAEEPGADSPITAGVTAERPAQAIESPLGDFVVELPAGYGEPLWKARGPKEVNFAAASGHRTVEVRSSPNETKGSKILDTATLFRMACNAVESSKDVIVDSSRDLEVDGQLARIYRTHPADPNQSGAVQMMFVASNERFYAVSMAAQDAAEFDQASSTRFFESFHVKSPALRASDSNSP